MRACAIYLITEELREPLREDIDSRMIDSQRTLKGYRLFLCLKLADRTSVQSHLKADKVLGWVARANGCEVDDVNLGLPTHKYIE